MSLRALITGGFGFIGSAVGRSLAASGYQVTNLDSLTYAASLARLPADSQIRHVQMDVRDPRLKAVVAEVDPQLIVHLAAETHVTRSESASTEFFSVNVDGTRNLLEAAATADAITLHVSTDEVYGPSNGRAFSESDKPIGEGFATSAYARSKALADDLAMEASASQPVMVVRPTNCFGPWQHPEKAIPRWMIRALLGMPIPVWGDGLYIRDWMYVSDIADGIRLVLEHGKNGEAYNLGPGRSDATNLEIARRIAELAGRSLDAVVLTAYDRPNHDRMYAVSTVKARSLGWEGGRDPQAALKETFDWYKQNDWWWRPYLNEAEALYEDREPRSP
jgi:dTDP-glucose 4,6-dehydratase